MDTDSLSFGYEEHFPVFESSNYLNIDDESRSMEETFDSSSVNNIWEWEVETELNGDVALIPMSSEVGMNYLSHSPPMKEDFQRIMSEWQNFMNIEVPDIGDLAPNAPLSADEEENITYIADVLSNPVPPTSPIPIDSFERKVKSTGKKIDMNAQCYILDEDEAKSLESEDSNSSDDESDFVEPKVEEIDILDEDFEHFCPKSELPDNEEALNSPVGYSREHLDSESDFIDVDTISNQDTPILEAGDLDSLLEQFEATETNQYFEPSPHPPTVDDLFEPPPAKPDSPIVVSSAVPEVEPAQEEPVPAPIVPKEPASSESDEPDKNKQILDALPQELIQRIKASSKRRMISVIDPIPSKRRGIKKPQVEIPVPQVVPQEKVEPVRSPESIQLDHDYCSLVTPYPKHPKKDSGFESAEEDEQRNILRNQPTVKGANGKLMVSLLKVNTIRSSIAAEAANKKKRKLNLEEYKKRREGIPRSCDNSQSNSPDNSGRNSPSIVEDEQVRLLKHQQKLMQMAAEVLKTPPKKMKPSSPTAVPPTEPPLPPPVEGFTVPPPPRIPPNNVEVKILVSIGVNTDHDASRVSKNVPVTELEEIKPLLKNANTKIDNNSLITSVIENLQSKKKVQGVSTPVQDKSEKKPGEQPHGEDKTIVYLDKGRPAVETKSIEVQTDEVAEDDLNKYKRRRNSSSSSSSDHRKSCKRRSSSNESHYSLSSESSISSSSSSHRSRSRSPSPRRGYPKKRGVETERERVREVEERRIVYVGGISSSMTKEALRRRFQQYGPITNVSVHFREYGDNYGFVTFVYKVDAYEAVEHGNDDPSLPQYDLSFGGRRIFCRTHYADLDNVQDELSYLSQQGEDSFDNLLREAQAKLRKRKST